MNKSHTQLVKMVMNCKVCTRILNRELARNLGKIKSKKKAKASRKNGMLGGRPRNK